MDEKIEHRSPTHGGKPDAVTTITRINVSDGINLTTSASADWTPGFWPRFPWIGFSCLMGTLLLSTASMIVLWCSNHKGYSQWSQHIAPHIILSGFNGLATLCVAVAVANGATITWWRQALQGTTVKTLQHTWSFSVSFLSILGHLRYFNVAAFAALAAKITIIDSILFQRAATVVIMLTHPPKDQNIATFPTTTFPITGFLNGTADGVRAFSDKWIDDLAIWSTSPWGKVSSSYGFGDCYDAVCAVNVSGIGFATSCVDDEPTLWDPLQTSCDQAFTTSQQAHNRSTLFSTEFTYRKPTPIQNYTWIELKVVSSVREEPERGSTQMCPVALKSTTCELRPALITYPVVMQYIGFDSTTQVDDYNQSYVTVNLGRLNSSTGAYLPPQATDFENSLQQIAGFEFERYLDIYENPPAFNASYLAGVVLALQGRFETRVSSNITAWFKGTTASHDNVVSTLSSSFQIDADLTNTTSWNTSQCIYYSRTEIDGATLFGAASQNPGPVYPYRFACGYSFSLQEVLTSIMMDLNTLMFITSEDPFMRPEAAEVSLYSQEAMDHYLSQTYVNVTGKKYLSEGHYDTNWYYAWGAFAATVVCILCILPSYWGFWELGRSVTLSPIEIANAFQAPVLVQCQHEHGYSCVHVKDVMKVAGREKVRYGAFQEPDLGGPSLRFATATTDV